MNARVMMLALSLSASSAACGGGRQPEPAVPATAELPSRADAVAGVDDAALADLLAEHWEWSLSRSPTWATTLGDHRFDDRLSDPSDGAVRAALEQERRFLERARALDPAGFSARDAITRELFAEELDHSIAESACDNHLWNVSANNNPVSGFNYLPKQHAITSAADARSLVARYGRIAGAVDAVIANLRLGLARGLVANAESIRRAAELVDGVLATPVDELALTEPAREPHKALTAEQQAALASDVVRIVDAEVLPAFARYRDLLRDELLPKARGADAPGLAALPIGEACYRGRIRSFTGLDRQAQELHDLGLAEIARINGEMKVLGQKLFGTAELPAILARLRTDRELYFETAADIVATSTESLAAARAAIPRYFGLLPKADCTVVPIPDYEAPYTTIAYYREPHYDGSKPGEFFVNTYQPETRPRFEAQVLTFHESIPGHHLQIAIAKEQAALPAFRKHGGQTAFVEGWALYTERLADEMQLYGGDLDRMGMLSYDAWRASRLVVDTGIHAFGWTRERAEAFMLEHTALAENNIANEVDRYISWPGQALAYKVGQLEIARLRAHARAELGERFDLRAFHTAVLEHGAVSLTVLARQIEAYITRAR